MHLNYAQNEMYHKGRKVTLLLSDIALITFAFFIASIYRLNSSPNFISVEYIGLSSIIITTLFIGGAYNDSLIISRPKLPLNTFFIVLSSTLPSLLFIYILGPQKFTALFGRGLFPFAIIGFGILSVANRFIINNLFHNKKNSRSVLLLGEEQSLERITSLLSKSKIKLKTSNKFDPSIFPSNTLTAIVLSPEHKPDESEQQILINYRLAGIPVYSLSDFFESFLFLIPVQAISNDWFIRSEGFTMLHNSVARRAKRATDIFSAIFLFLLTLPLTIITAFAIKLSSSGPIFFSQMRVGKHGAIFKVYKFRTMHTDAEYSGAQWASENDSRIILGGSFLRKTRIDEIPQCWNILKGEMSFIGPRPERPEFTSTLNKEIPYYDLRHVVKPGLTGWAQVKYPYGASTEDSLRKLQFDLYYIKNYSLLLDLNIVLRTIKITLLRGGR